DIDVQTEEAEELLVVSSTSRPAAGSEHNATKKSLSSKRRFQVTPKTSHLNAVKRIFKYLKGKPNLGLWYPRESPLDLEAFSDSDYGGSNLDRKSTTGGCQFLGQRLISWQCKKQTIVATSTTCGQVLWVQNQLLDYGFNFMNTKIHIDNESTICIVKNPVYHSKTKHIEIRHHFIRDCYEKKLISVEKIHTDLNVADLLTKPFDGPRFNYLVVSIELILHSIKSASVKVKTGNHLILVLLGVEKSEARSTWAWKRKCQVSLANWMQFGSYSQVLISLSFSLFVPNNLLLIKVLLNTRRLMIDGITLVILIIQPMNENYFEPNYSGQYSINHQPPSIQENLNHQKMYELLQIMQSFCEKLLQQKQAANIDQSSYQEMSIQEMEDLKLHYLDEMLSLSNDLQIKDYRNEKIDIRFRRECESMIDELKGKLNGMNIEINKKKELQRLEQVANLSTYPSQRFKSFCYDDDDDYDYEESTIPLNEINYQIPPSIAITPILPTLEPEDSLIMGDEHLSTI
ncbi:hypothetical protein Tco_0553619, partial [Tanacetum coccineum]